MAKLKVKELEKLSQLIYKRNHFKLVIWLKQKGIKKYELYKIEGNDRTIIFEYEKTLYIATAGSDDRADWLENIQIRTVKRLFRMFRGVAYPAEDITEALDHFCDKHFIDISSTDKRVIGHSRGDNLSEGVVAILNDEFGEKHTKGYGFGGTGAGSRRFFKKCKCNNYIRFQIEGDFGKWINPIDKCIGRVIKLPRQRKGFKWFFGLFKGKMNHRSYDCVADFEYGEWD